MKAVYMLTCMQALSAPRYSWHWAARACRGVHPSAQLQHAQVVHAGAQGLKEKKLVQDNLDKVDKLKPIAETLGVPLAQLALAWWAARALLAWVGFRGWVVQIPVEELGRVLPASYCWPGWAPRALFRVQGCWT